MKELKKVQLVSIQSALTQLKTVGIPPRKVVSLIKLLRKSRSIVEELTDEQRELINRYGIGSLPEEGRLDPASEHFSEYLEAYAEIMKEPIDVSEFGCLTLEEACIATADITVPLGEKELLVELLTEEE